MMAHDVFISYATEDRAIADEVCGILEQRGVSCWIAPRDVLPGTKYAEAILDAIESSRVFVLVLTRESNESPHVLREVERAVSKDIAFMPLRVGRFRLSRALEFLISAHQWLEAASPPTSVEISTLGDRVAALLSQKQRAGRGRRVSLFDETSATESPGALQGLDHEVAKKQFSRVSGWRFRRVAAISAVVVGSLGLVAAGYFLYQKKLAPGNRPVFMPGLAGVSVAQAWHIADSLDMTLVAVDSVLSDEVGTGDVVAFTPKAGAEVAKGDTVRVTYSCGRRTCPQCGTTRRPGAKFCTKCGYAFVAVQAESTKVEK